MEGLVILICSFLLVLSLEWWRGKPVPWPAWLAWHLALGVLLTTYYEVLEVFGMVAVALPITAVIAFALGFHMPKEEET